MVDFFFSLFVKGAFNMDIGFIEGAIPLVLKHCKAHFDLKKIDHSFLLKWNLNSLKRECFGIFCEDFKSGSSLVFLNVPYQSTLETKMLC